MCGILGFNFNNPEKCKSLINLISHRGPDDEGIFTDKNISLGHKRLSIIDLSIAGHQPMFYSKENGACSEKFLNQNIKNTTIGIVYNGEIYNFLEIKSELNRLGYSFTTNCDTEIILASYFEWGTDCVKKFNGMWAFAIYDIAKQILFLSRDRLGIKPLYYYNYNKKFIFGSEVKVFLKSEIEKNIDNEAINYYYLFGFTPPNKSILQNVSKLLPGHNLIFNLKTNKIEYDKEFWNIEFKNENIPLQQLKSNIYKQLDESVKKRLLSDVPVGAFLSGGIDSSIIVYFMRKHIQDLNTFSVKFDYQDFNESQWSQKVANKFNTRHFEIEFNSTDVENLIETLPYYFDEPFADQSMIPTFLVSKVAKEHVTVCLSGTGSDEIFAGYPRHKEYLLLHKISKLPDSLKSTIILIYKTIANELDRVNKLKELLFSSKDKMYIKLFSNLFRSPLEPRFNFDLIAKENLLNQDNTLESLLKFEQKIYLPEDLLIKEDRSTMAHSLEGRFPFLDYHLVELVNSIPSKYKIKNGVSKYILKKTFEGILPDEILYRKKQGFGVPLKHYFRKELSKLAYHIIFESHDNEFYDKKTLKTLWDAHQSGKSDYSALFWNIIMYNKWFERWMK